MMWQRLDGRGSLATAVQQVVQGALGDLVPPEKRVVEKRVSSHTGALSRARTRLPLEAAEAVCDQVFATLIQSAQAGPAVAVVSGGWLLDAPAAHPSLREGLSARWQSAWGAHWPVIRVLTAHHWSSGLAVSNCMEISIDWTKTLTPCLESAKLAKIAGLTMHQVHRLVQGAIGATAVRFATLAGTFGKSAAKEPLA